MMASLDSSRKVREILDDMNSQLAKVYIDWSKRLQIPPIQRTQADTDVFRDVELVFAELERAQVKIFANMYADAQAVAAYAKKNPAAAPEIEKRLERFHSIFETAHTQYIQHLRTSRFFYQFTAKLDSLIKKLIKGTNHLEKIHAKKIAELRKAHT